jgi:lipoprotein signal peptidase
MRLLTRIVSAFLVPCLIFGPDSVSAFSSPVPLQTNRKITTYLFEQQALVERLISRPVTWRLDRTFPLLAKLFARFPNPALLYFSPPDGPESSAASAKPERFGQTLFWVVFPGLMVAVADFIGRYFASSLITPGAIDIWQPFLHGAFAIGHARHPHAITTLYFLLSGFLGLQFGLFLIRSMKHIGFDIHVPAFWASLEQGFRYLTLNRRGQVGAGLFIGSVISNSLTMIFNPNVINWIAVNLAGPGGASRGIFMLAATNFADIGIVAGLTLWVINIFQNKTTDESNLNADKTPSNQGNKGIGIQMTLTPPIQRYFTTVLMSGLVAIALADNLGRHMVSKMNYSDFAIILTQIFGRFYMGGPTGFGYLGPDNLDLAYRYFIWAGTVLFWTIPYLIGTIVHRFRQKTYSGLSREERWDDSVSFALANRWGQLGLGLYLGGIISNTLNLLIRPGKINWLHIIGFIPFNLADVGVIVGFIVFSIQLIMTKPKGSAKHTSGPFDESNQRPDSDPPPGNITLRAA